MTERGGKAGKGGEGWPRWLGLFAAALLTGLAGGLLSAVVLHGIEASRRCFAFLDARGGSVAVTVAVLLPLVGAAAAGALAPRAAAASLAHGAFDCLEATDRRGQERVAPMRKLAACLLTVLSGGSAGCEGMLGQSSAAFGTWAFRRFGPRSYDLQVLAGCGLCAAFGGLLQAPIAGCLLAAEVVLGGYAIRNLLPLGLAAFGSAFVSRWTLGRGPIVAPEFEIVAPAELAAHACVGMAAGLLALALVKALARTASAFDRLAVRDWMKAALGGAVVGGVGLLWPQIRGVGYQAIGTIVTDPLLPATLGALLLAKVVGSSATLGSGGIGGMIAPSMFMGASLGSLAGWAIHQAWPQATSGPHSYAVVGMVAVLAGVTRAPLTSIALGAELSGNYVSLLPCTIAVVASVLMASTWSKVSSTGVVRGPPVLRNSGMLQQRLVSDLMRRTGDVIASDAPMAEVLQGLTRCRDDVLVVIEPERGRVVGVVSLDHVKALLGREARAPGTAYDLMITTPALRQDEPLTLALAAMSRSKVAALPVVGKDGRLMGVVTRYDVMEVCANELLQGMPGLDESGAPLEGQVPVEHTPHVHEVSAVPAPREFVGSTLRELDLLRRWGVACVGLRKATEHGELTAVPLDMDRPLRVGDVMILIGDRANIEKVCGLERASKRPAPA